MIAIGPQNEIPDIKSITSPYVEHKELLSAIQEVVANPKLILEKLPAIIELIDSAYQTPKLDFMPKEPISTFGELHIVTHRNAEQLMFATMKDDTLVTILESFGRHLQKEGLEIPAAVMLSRSEHLIMLLGPNYSLLLNDDNYRDGFQIGNAVFKGYGIEALDMLDISEAQIEEIENSYPDYNFAVAESNIGGSILSDTIRSLESFFLSNSCPLLLQHNDELLKLTADNYLALANEIDAKLDKEHSEYHERQKAEKEAQNSKVLKLVESLPTTLRHWHDRDSNELYGPLLTATIFKEALYLVVQLKNQEALAKWYNAGYQEQLQLASGITVDSGLSQSIVFLIAQDYLKYLEQHSLSTPEEFQQLLLTRLRENKGISGVRAYLDSTYARIKNEPLLLNENNRAGYAQVFEEWGMGYHAQKIREMTHPSDLVRDMYLGLKTPLELAKLIDKMPLRKENEMLILKGFAMTLKDAGLLPHLLNEYVEVFNRNDLHEIASEIGNN